MAKDVSPIAVALQLAETKYKDDKVIQSLVSNYESYLSLYEVKYVKYPSSLTNMDMIKPYVEGLRGKPGYSLTIGQDTIRSLCLNPIQMLIDLSSVQTRADCLIMAMQALGEEIEY